MTLSAQSPPPLLQIVQERLNPGAEQPYGKIEEEIAHLCARMNCPNWYLAIASVTLPREVWWLNTSASQADVDRVGQSYARNTALTTAMRELSQGKKGLTSDPIDLMATTPGLRATQHCGSAKAAVNTGRRGSGGYLPGFAAYNANLPFSGPVFLIESQGCFHTAVVPAFRSETCSPSARNPVQFRRGIVFTFARISHIRP